MKKIFWLILIIITAISSFFAGYFLSKSKKEDDSQLTLIKDAAKEKPLEKYAFENLSIADIKPGKIEIGEFLDEKESYVSKLFTFTFSPALDKRQKTTTGQINIPKNQGTNSKFPLIVMFRGYIDQQLFQTGDGTRRAAEFFADNGFISLAPDFLGYAGSDKEAENIFEARFQTYTTALSLIKSVDQIAAWDNNNLFIWGHSNGGQIALTYLAISKASYPTTLWAPVSKPFPYSVLYYTDEAEDEGKLIRGELAKFEKEYHVFNYSITNYLENIKAPLQIHQGSADTAVPKSWSDSLVARLQLVENKVNYFTYPGADHNLTPSWDSVIQRDLDFFNFHISN